MDEWIKIEFYWAVIDKFGWKRLGNAFMSLEWGGQKLHLHWKWSTPCTLLWSWSYLINCLFYIQRTCQSLVHGAVIGSNFKVSPESREMFILDGSSYLTCSRFNRRTSFSFWYLRILLLIIASSVGAALICVTEPCFLLTHYPSDLSCELSVLASPHPAIYALYMNIIFSFLPCAAADSGTRDTQNTKRCT